MKKKRFAFWTALIAIVAVNSIVTMAAKSSYSYKDGRVNFTYDADLSASGFIWSHNFSADLKYQGIFDRTDFYRASGCYVKTWIWVADDLRFYDAWRIIGYTPKKEYEESFKVSGMGLSHAGIEVRIDKIDGGSVYPYCYD